MMLYFIPAWYQKGQWCENEQSWTMRRMRTEFDDTVKQIQLFHRSGTCPCQIALLGFAPNFRHFLHRQGMYRVPYWSCFDAIQEVRRRKAAVLSFHRLKWPKGIEFVYSPFVVLAFLKKEKYAQIDFGEGGNPIRIDLYQNGRICRRNIYDDRGFISSTILYENGEPVYQDYLMENGMWKLRHFQGDGHVEINEKCPEYLLLCRDGSRSGQFLRKAYESLEQVIEEVVTSWLWFTEKADVFCAAMHELHAELLGEVLQDKKVILSFFSDRPLDMARPGVRKLTEQADFLIADSEKYRRQIREETGVSQERTAAIPPYDSRVDFGISRQIRIRKLLVPVDGLEEEVFGRLIRLLGEYLLREEGVQIHLFTRRAEYDRKERLLEQARAALRSAGLEEGWAAVEAETGTAENGLEEGEPAPVRFFAEQCVSELEVSRCMREQRLLVDIREAPEVYLQITALSLGIPQIVRTETEFVEPGRNGMLLEKTEKLPKLLDYYLHGLKNWNAAMVSSYEIGKAYTTDRLLERWREVMESVG